MPSQAEMAAAFARMRQNNSEAGAGIRNGAIDMNNVYGNHLGDAPSIPPISFGAKGSSNDDEPLWLKAITGIFAPGKAVTNQFANWTDGKLNWKDIPLAESVQQGAKSQWNDWTDGKLSWGDVPGAGFLYGVGDQGKGFGKTLTNLGAKPGGYLEKIGGLEGDMLFDPMNLATFGAGSAVKAGAKASQIAAKGLAKEAGLVVSKKALGDVPDLIANAYRAKHINNPDIDKYLVEDLTSKIKSEAAQKISDAGAAKRAKAQNAIINFDLPGTNITKQFGQKANIPLVGKYLHISDAKIGQTGAAAVADAFAKAGLDPADPQIAKILKGKYGVDNAADLTTQGLKHLQDELGKINPTKAEFNPKLEMEQFATNLNPYVDYNKFNLNDALSGLGRKGSAKASSILDAFGLGDNIVPDILGKGRNLGTDTARLADEGADILGNEANKMFNASNATKRPAITNTQDALNKLSKVLHGAENIASIKYAPTPEFKISESIAAADKAKNIDIANFVQDMGGKSALGRTLGKANPFNARAFKSSDVLASQSANDVRDATTKIHGQTRQANEQIASVEKAMEGMSATEKRAVIYETQNHYPKGFDKSSIDEAKVQAAAKHVKAIMDQIGQRDLKAGGIKDLRSNYYPHVLKKDGTNVEQLVQDPDIARILGMNKSNNFGKARKGFQTIAQMDEVISGLEKAAKAETDTAKAEKLLEKADKLRNLFHTDVPSALGYRADKSIRSSAYSELFSKLEKDGLMARPSTTRSQTKVHADSNQKDYKKLTADEAKVLGVEAGTMIHKDTFEGMKRVHELFTAEGANKLFENINVGVNMWKSLVTSYIPAHYFNNFVGNIANNTLAGVKPDSYKAASKLLKSMKSGNVSPEDAKIVQAAYDKGVFGAGFDSDFVKSQFKTDKKTFDQKVSNTKWATYLRKYGNNGDDYARLALFMHGMKQTGSIDKSAAMVRKYLFNYSERSHGDNFARAAMPFWMWTKNNLPLQIQGMMQQPRYYETYKKIKDAFNEDVEGGKNKQYTTDNYLHIPGTKVGLSLNSLPLNELGKFGAGSPFDPLRSGLGMLAPPLKMPSELALNRQYFNNSPVYYEGKEAEGVGNYLKNQTGVIGKLLDIADGDGNKLLELLGGIIGKPTEYK